MALIAVAAIGAFSLFGDVARNQVVAMAFELGGTSGQAAVSQATSSGTAATALTTGTNLSTFRLQKYRI